MPSVHGLLVGQRLAREGRVVNGHNLVAGQHTGLLGGAVANDILHAQGVVADDELDAHARERAAQVVVGCLHILGADVDRVGVQLREYLRHGLFHQVAHIHGVYILVVDDVEQIVQLVAA